MNKIEIEESLIFYTDFINLTIKLNKNIKDYESLGIETPIKIKQLVKDINLSSNLIIIFSDCLTIAKCFNESNIYLFQGFFIKSIYRVIHEAFEIINNKSNKYLFESFDTEISTEKIKNLKSEFQKKYNLAEIKKIRNKVSAHYSDKFIEHINDILSIDFQNSINMFYDFLKLVTEISKYLSLEKFNYNTISNDLVTYFNDVEDILKTKN